MVIRRDDFLGLMGSTQWSIATVQQSVHKPNWIHSNYSQVLQEATKQIWAQDLLVVLS